MTKIAIITGSVRPARKSLTVASWVKDQADQRTDAEFEIVDIADYHLPVWSHEPPATMGQHAQEAASAWSAKIAEFDGFVFIVAEYNHSISGALKNALDYLRAEVANKAAGFVSYGSMGGARAVEHLRGILSELQVAHVRNQVTMPLSTEFQNVTTFVPSEVTIGALPAMLDQLMAWTRAMETVRADQLVSAAAR